MDTASLTYGEFVASRAKNPADILLTLTEAKADLLHAAIGLAGEAGELVVALQSGDLVNIEEELGDIEFYAQMALTNLDIKLVDIMSLDNIGSLFPACPDLGSAYTVAATEFLDQVKKYVIYNKPMPASLHTNLGRVLATVSSVMSSYGFSRGGIRAANREKLERRYPTGYTDAHAQARLDKVADEPRTADMAAIVEAEKGE